MDFAYVAKSKSGEEVTGLTSGGSLDDAIAKLHEQELTILHVGKAPARSQTSSWRAQFGSLTFGTTSTRDLALFSRQLATVLEAGIPLVKGLRGLAADSSSRVLKKAIADVALRLETGEKLSDAMGAHPESFNTMYLSMVRAGERAGTLDEIMEHLAAYLEKVDAIKSKVQAALSYPVFVLIFAILAMLFLLLKIVPTFAQIYADLGQQLPKVTQLVIAASNAIRANAMLTAGICLALMLLAFLAIRTQPGRYAFDSFKINQPVFGPIIRKAVMSRFARTFGILVKSGLPILEGLELVKGASGNAVVAVALDDIKRKMAAGQGLTESFRSTGKFPEMVLQLMSTGEEAGDLDGMMIKTSDFYDRQVEASVQGITSLIEPLMIVIVGAMIGVVVVSMFMPIFYLGDAIMRGGYNY